MVAPSPPPPPPRGQSITLQMAGPAYRLKIFECLLASAGVHMYEYAESITIKQAYTSAEWLETEWFICKRMVLQSWPRHVLIYILLNTNNCYMLYWLNASSTYVLTERLAVCSSVGGSGSIIFYTDPDLDMNLVHFPNPSPPPSHLIFHPQLPHNTSLTSPPSCLIAHPHPTSLTSLP